MGIPLYFNKITNQYKNVVHSNKQKCDRLFLDFNGIIHNVVNTIKSQVAIDMPLDEFEELLIEKIIEYMDYVCAYASPSKLLYICIDGVAPLPKIIQQRKRRYFSNWIHSKTNENNTYHWDSNAISPGTSFMLKLNKNLRRYVQTKTLTYEIILSDSSEKGEGEHKIFDYIHFHEPSNNIDVIYGLDADLIMLSLICSKTKKFLLREPQYFHNSNSDKPFLWFNVETFKYNLINYYDNKIDIHSYVFLCFLLGNDFLPNLSYLKIVNDGIDKIIKAYINVSERYHKPIIYVIEYDKYEIDISIFTSLIYELKSKEDIEMKELHNNYYKKTMIFKNTKAKYENYGVSFKNKRMKNVFDNTNWRPLYYTNLFDMNIHCDDTISKSCKNYIEGLFWTMNYYFNKKIVNNWYYIYNYSPTMLDMYNYCEVTKTNFSQEEKVIDISPQIQLMIILPIQSIEVLPDDLKAAMQSNNIIHMYPIKFDIESYMKYKLHECFPILPHVDIKELRIAYLNTIS